MQIPVKVAQFSKPINKWVAWFNHHRLLSSIGYIPPAEAEVNYYRQLAESNETEVST
jgi:hypothetical protein